MRGIQVLGAGVLVLAVSAGGADAETRFGKLRLVSEPAGATVYVDGDQQVGTTPLTVALPYGVHKVDVLLSDYEDAVREVDLRLPALTVSFALKPEIRHGRLSIERPVGYRAVVDGVEWGRIPVTGGVDEGEHTFTLVNPGDGAGCTLRREIKFEQLGRPEFLFLACP